MEKIVRIVYPSGRLYQQFEIGIETIKKVYKMGAEHWGFVKMGVSKSTGKIVCILKEEKYMTFDYFDAFLAIENKNDSEIVYEARGLTPSAACKKYGISVNTIHGHSRELGMYTIGSCRYIDEAKLVKLVKYIKTHDKSKLVSGKDVCKKYGYKPEWLYMLKNVYGIVHPVRIGVAFYYNDDDLKAIDKWENDKQR